MKYARCVIQAVLGVAVFIGVILGFDWTLTTFMAWNVWAGIGLCAVGMGLLGLAIAWSLDEIPDEEIR